MSGAPQNINKERKWKDECEDDNFHYRIRNYYECFYKLPKWHQDFFRSLKFSIRLEQSLSQIHHNVKQATELFENAEYDRSEGLRPIMEIRRISGMIFPLVMYDIERNHLEKALIACIEYEGMRARGVNWWDCDINLSEFEIDDLSQHEQKERLDRYSGVLVHIDDVEEMVNRGAISWKAVKYLKVWRYYLEDRAIKAKPADEHTPELKINAVGNIANWEKRIIDCYEKLGTVRQVHERGIVREDTGLPAGWGAVARVIKEYNEEQHNR